MIDVMLIFLRKINKKSLDGSSIGLYYCVCGKFKEIEIYRVDKRKVKSCGCLSKQMLHKYRCSKVTHGMSQNCDEYEAWAGMKERCYNPNTIGYNRYGGRGIKVCERWLNSFENFYKDMGDKPSKKHSLDRKKNSQDYSPDNCRWATKKEQERNKDNNRLITYKDITKTLVEWSEETNIGYYVIAKRLDRYNWSIERALTTPTRPKKKHES